jgi:hypothetical protein
VGQCLFRKQKRGIGLISAKIRNLILINNPAKTGTHNKLDLKRRSNELFQVPRMSRIRQNIDVA